MTVGTRPRQHPDCRCLVVWHDERNVDTRGVDVHARRVTGLGGLSTQALISSAADIVDQAWAKVASGTSHHLIVWKVPLLLLSSIGWRGSARRHRHTDRVGV